VVAVVAMGWLGWWQLQSFEDSRVPDAAPRRAVAVDRVTEPGGRLGPGDPGRAVRASGTWEAGSQVTVPGREVDGRTGSLVVTPLRTAAGVLPVVRGWVAEGSPVPAPPAGTVTVRGPVQASETEADAPLATVVADGEVAYVATVTLLEKLPYAAEELYDGFVVLRSVRPADPDAPRPVEARDRDAAGTTQGGRWRNLAYAVQWWLFAGAAVFFWGAVLRRAAQEQQHPGRGHPSGQPPVTPAAPRQRT
jgi:cytochrome oxidase assembly protein ShyY1